MSPRKNPTDTERLTSALSKERSVFRNSAGAAVDSGYDHREAEDGYTGLGLRARGSATPPGVRIRRPRTPERVINGADAAKIRRFKHQRDDRRTLPGRAHPWEKGQRTLRQRLSDRFRR